MHKTAKSDTTREVLARQVAERQKFIEEIVEYVSSLLARRGVTLSWMEFACHTTAAIELKNFAGFSFHTYGTYTMFGGETVKVWYHPNAEETPREPVFEVEFWDIAQCTVKHFNPSTEWQKAFKRLIAYSAAIEARFEQEQKTKQERKKRAAQERQRMYEAERRLQKDAARLKL